MSSIMGFFSFKNFQAIATAIASEMAALSLKIRCTCDVYYADYDAHKHNRDFVNSEYFENQNTKKNKNKPEFVLKWMHYNLPSGR